MALKTWKLSKNYIFFLNCETRMYVFLLQFLSLWVHRKIYILVRKNRKSEVFFFYFLLEVKWLFEKSNFCPKIQFWPNPNIFHEFFTLNFFLQFFSWNQSCPQLKSPKPQHFHEFSPKTIRQFFLRKSKLNFWTKNEDFEQCARGD